jgi:hypothetical protein
MPDLERSSLVDARPAGGEQSYRQRQHREAMAISKSPQALNPRANDHRSQWEDDGWDHDHDEAVHRARALLSQPSLGLHEVSDRIGALRMWFSRERWVRRLAVTAGILALIFGACFAALWWRLGAGPIDLEMATPWLAAAIEDNIGNGNSVEVGGTQIERVGRIRIAVRIRDIVVRDRDHAVVASAPKAEVRLSGMALLTGRLRAESLNLVDAELSVRIMPDGQVTVSTGDNARPLATGVVPTRQLGSTAAAPEPSPPPSAQASPPAGAPPGTAAPAADGRDNAGGLLAGLDWLDSLSLTGLDGQNLNEIGLKNGNLIVDDQQRGNHFNFSNITLSLRRPSGGGVVLSVGEEGKQAWSLRVAVGAPANGVRSIDIKADKVSTKNMMLALRAKDLTLSADLPLTGQLKGELGRDGVPTYFRGKLTAGPGSVVDTDTPKYPMAIDQIEIEPEWDAGRRVLLAPFKIVSGANRITILAHLEPPNGVVTDWQLGFSGGTVVLPGGEGEQPLIFNRISIGIRFDTEHRRVILSEANISNGEIGIAGTGSIDYAAEPRMNLGFAATPMSASALKRVWPTLVVPELREWVIERVERGSLQRLEVSIGSPLRNLSRHGPPIPDDGLAATIIASNVTLRPVDNMPAVRDGDLRAHITGRTATVTIGQAAVDTPAGRKLAISDAVFEIPDLAPKPAPCRVKFRIDGPVPAAAEILNSNRLSDVSGNLIDPNSSKGTVAAQITLDLPVKGELTKEETLYNVSADLSGFAADHLVMGRKLEANSLKVVANNQGYLVKGDVKIDGQPAQLEYRKPAEGDADIKLQAALDDASRAKLGFPDLGSAVSGNLPIKLNGKIGAPDHDSRLGVEADLTQLKLDNVLPGWVKLAGKSSRAVFNVVQKAQSTSFENIVIDGGGVSIKGSLEIDQNGDLMNANFPTYQPSERDRSAIKAERSPDGVLKLTMRGDVFDGSGFLKSVLSGKEADARNKPKNFDFDVDLKLGLVAGYNGETVRSLDVKLSRRNGSIRSFALSAKLGKDTPLTGELRSLPQGRGDVVALETDDAGALFKFTDTYSKMRGGRLELAMDPPTAEPRAKEGLINIYNFSIKGDANLDRVAAGGPAQSQAGIAFTRLRAEFTSQNGQLTIHQDGVVRGPTVGGTISGNIDFPRDQVRMSGTFIPLYGINNLMGQIPVFGLLLGAGSNEGLFGITYEVVGSPGAPEVHINPMSAIAPGLFRKIFDFGTGKQPIEYPPSANSPNNN